MHYAVTGATGELAQHVFEDLLAQVPATSIVALARSPEKGADLATKGIDVRAFDYDRPEALAVGLQGVDRLLLISSSERGRRVAQHAAVIEAAKAAGVALIVYTSTLAADTSPLAIAGEHRDTEALLAASGMPFVILRNNWYVENYTAQIPNALRLGFILGAAGDGWIAAASRADYAAAAAETLLQVSPPIGTAIELASNDSFTLTDLAAEISRQTGRTIAYRDMSPAEYEETLFDVGLPPHLVCLLADADDGAAKGAMDHRGRELGTLIGRPTETLADSVERALVLATETRV